MLFGFALMAFVAGAVLLFAVSASIVGISVNAIGAFLMFAGALTAFAVAVPSRHETTRRPGSDPPPY